VSKVVRSFPGLSSADELLDDICSPFAGGRMASSSSSGLDSSPTGHTLNHRRGHSRSDAVRRRLGFSSQTLPSGSLRAKQPSFKAISTDATRHDVGHAPPVVQGVQLIPTTKLPDRFRSLFPYPVLNAIQSKCFPTIFESDTNLVLSAPTGSGKTVAMELAICRLVTLHGQEDFKVVYQAPTKSLCSERFRDWQCKFSTLDLQCAELTGDTDHHQLRSVQNANIIITTPEKWDSVTRKWKDHSRLMQLVRLFLIDEVHILKDARGATLEAVVSRMKSVGSNVRFVALSATVPNSEDIATWLGKNPTAQHLPAQREVFGDEFRPVQLRNFVYGYPSKQNDFAFDTTLSNK